MASPMHWTWTWANFRRWCGTERPGVWQSMRSQRVRIDLVTELHGDFIYYLICFYSLLVAFDRASLIPQLVKNLPAMWETWVGKIWRREKLPTPLFWPRQFHGLCSPWVRRVGHDWTIFTLLLLADTLIYVPLSQVFHPSSQSLPCLN